MPTPVLNYIWLMPISMSPSLRPAASAGEPVATSPRIITPSTLTNVQLLPGVPENSMMKLFRLRSQTRKEM